MRSWTLTIMVLALACGEGTPGPAGKDGARGEDGADGPTGKDGGGGSQGGSCSVTQNDDGSATITCEDGSSATVGSPGAEAPPTRLRFSVVLPGAACLVGGTRVEAGADDDGDGLLDDAEVEDTQILCDEPLMYPGDFVLDDSSDAAALNAYDGVAGDLTVSDLDVAVMLPRLRTVEGDLHVTDNAVPLSLPVLGEVGGDVTLSGQSASGLQLPALATVGGCLELGAEPGFTSLPLLESVDSLLIDGAGGALAFPVLTTIAADAVIDASDLTALALPALEDLGGDLELRGWSPGLALALGNLSEVGGDLRLVETSLVAVVPVGGVTTVGGSLVLEGNAALTDVSALAGLAVNGLSVRNNPLLESLPGVPIGVSLSAGLAVTGNALIDDLTPLAVVESVGGDVEIAGPAFTTLTGLAALTTVGGRLVIGPNPELADLAPHAGRESVGALRIAGNPLLTDLSGLEDLGAAPDGIELVDNAALVSLAGLSGVTGPCAVVKLNGSPLVASLEDLEGVSGVQTLDLMGSPLIDDVSHFVGTQTAMNTVRLNDLPLVTTLFWPALESAELVQLHSTGLTSVDLSGLEHTANVSISGNASLLSLDLGALQSAEFVYIFANDQLAALDLHSLTIAEDLIVVGGTYASLSLPLLTSVTDIMQIEWLPNLTALDLSQLDNVRWMSLRYISVPQCDLIAVRDGLIGEPDGAYLGGDDPCDPNPCGGACVLSCAEPEPDYACP